MSGVKMKLFTEEELKDIFNLPKNTLPLNNECLKYILTRRNEKDHQQVVRSLANTVFDLWRKADCCPLDIRSICRQIENLWERYRTFQKQGESGRKHRSNKVKVNVVPSRSSNRIKTKKVDLPCEVEVENQPVLKPPEKKQKITTRSDDIVNMRDKWDLDFGKKLLDVKNSEDIIREHVHQGYAFDYDFYEDQRNERLYIMDICKVTVAFKEAETVRKNRESRQYLRKQSAYGVTVVNSTESRAEAEEECQEYLSDKDDEYAHSVSKNSYSSIIETRSERRKQVESIKPVVSDKETQCNLIIETPTKIMSSKDSQKSTRYEPKYLQAIGLMMSDGLSAPQAIKATHTVDTVIWQQKRYLPLNLDKDYKTAYSKIKKLEKQRELVSKEQLESTRVDDIDKTDVDANKNDDNLLIDLDVEDENSNIDLINKLKKVVSDKKSLHDNNHLVCLPDPQTARNSHYLMSVYVEGRIGEEMLEKGGFSIPDGTTRNKVGEIAGMLLKVGDTMRAVKAQRIGKGDRTTWAETIVHMLNRLGKASKNDVNSLWISIRSILSDLCKVNKNLGEEIKGILGSEWQPGQLFCVLHYVLAIPEAIKTVFETYQKSIGVDKLFPETTGFEMNVDEKIIVVQILDIWMRLTSIRWHGRAWNKYDGFTKYAEERGIKNVGHMIHANRFGEFEERCAGGVYLADTWVKWLHTYSSIRNSLSCYLRTVIGLMEVCIFQWCAASLIGLHLTAPFMSMLIDHKATQRKLLVILPQLYEELHAYPASMIEFDKPALNSLSDYWLPPFEPSTSPYGVDVFNKIKDYCDACDKKLMNMCLKEICCQAAIILKRQRGDAYGFGDVEDSPEMIIKNLSEDMLDDPDATNSKKIENYLGNLDRYLTSTGPQGFDKITDDLVIKYGKDLLGSEMAWTTQENRKAAREIKIIQSEFDKKQEMLKCNGIEDADVAALTTENRVQRVVAQCKKNHKGPITDRDELDQLVVKLTTDDQKQLHAALNLEIRFRKFTMTKVKGNCPLFAQRNISIEEKVKNLRLLIDSQELGLRALATMEDLEEVILEVGNKNEEINGVSEKEQSIPDNTDESDLVPEESNFHITLTPKTGEFVNVLCEDGFYPGEVIDIVNDEVHINFLSVKKHYPNDGLVNIAKKYWVWPDKVDHHWIHYKCIMEIRPSLQIDIKKSTRRMIIYELKNIELINKFLETP